VKNPTFREAYSHFRSQGYYSARFWYGGDLALLCSIVSDKATDPNLVPHVSLRLADFKAKRANGVRRPWPTEILPLP